MSRSHPNHIDHGFIRCRNNVGQTNLREYLPARKSIRSLHRGRCVPLIATTALEMRTRMSEEGERGNKHFSHFSPETNLFEELERVFRDYGESGTGTTRHYVHDDDEAKLYGRRTPVPFTAWGSLPEKSDLLFYEGLHAPSSPTGSTSRNMPTSRSASCR